MTYQDNLIMTDPRNIHISDYDYPLPDERIAKYPLAERDSSKLLVYNGGTVGEDRFTSLPSYLPPGALMVFNNTKVIHARLHFRKETGAMIEVFCMEPFMPLDYQLNFASKGSCEWLCMIGNLKRWKGGVLSRTVNIGGRDVTLSAERILNDGKNGENRNDGNDGSNGSNGNDGGTKHHVRFSWDAADVSFSEMLEACGELPIPPYLNRSTEESDLRTYQTVYSKVKGSVAAPTAGLHFTEQVLKAIDERGIDREELTLHVGAGTFKPVKSEEIRGHEMHSEYIVVKRSTIEKLIKHGGKAIAVGTTSVRTLESLYYIGRKLERSKNLTDEELHVDQWEAYDRTEEAEDTTLTLRYLNNILEYLDTNDLPALHTSTQIIIAPGYKYHIVNRIITNFHQPRSTLLLLVSAFVGEDWRKIYDFALTHDFRFLSYGDSSLLIP